eukprot:352965-Chlamydomonas_euryale.AAC.27
MLACPSTPHGTANYTGPRNVVCHESFQKSMKDHGARNAMDLRGCRIEEDHRKPIFCITFNMLDPHNADIFASCGANRASVYRCGPDGETELMQAYTGVSSHV